METIKYKGFIGSVEVSIADNCIHGKILFINDLITYQANGLDQIEQEFQEAVEDYFETCKELKIDPLKSFNGSFNVRVGSELHQRLALNAIEKDKNINSIVKKAIEKYLDKSKPVSEVHNHHNTFDESKFSTPGIST
ncbi:MAG: type II toxin-antitoxin system HicB family antitoxin [Deltaproteobacteria bacterium]|uniref:type II toxin-antitoxin system HicB family antitoxin n=1 Tax=Desulfobacula sp. TaxID=2593537 RepID=UPI0019B171EA|nr:type II toxin-antitoxin system HicB family antitoxin [Candidatus Desulfobacula maris]MBL6993780.1 type II toxin-antitoxin system HicB family antitoxin [Desulfobacula sp.]